MFNDLESSNLNGANKESNSNFSQDNLQVNSMKAPSPSSTPEVDDIFAETDKVSEGRKNLSDNNIETKKVGLAADDVKFDSPDKPKNSLFKILTIVIIVIVVVLLAYVAYSKFFKTASVVEKKVNVPVKQEKKESPKTTTKDNTKNQVKEETNKDQNKEKVNNNFSDTNTPSTTEPNQETNNVEKKSTVTPVFVPVVDSDNDGLTDDEEIIAGTNINIIDTDNDGLSDYEEIKIYKTNPLNADTDGDGYQDGQEVKGGYNPNGPGKLLDNK